MTTLTRNFGLSIVSFSTRIISGSIIYILLARVMSLNDFGLLSFGVTFAGLIAVIAEFGFSLMAQRDIPQNRYPLNEYIYNTMIQKMVFSALSLIGGGIYLWLFFEGDNLAIGLIFLGYAILTAQVMYFLAVFRAKNEFKVEMWSSLIYFVLIAIMVIVYFVFELEVFYVAWGIFIARFFHVIYLLVAYSQKFGTKGLNYSKTVQKYLFKNSFSFGLHYIIGIFYFSIDSQLVAYYSGNEQLAIYQSFFNIIMAMLMINELLSNVFLPYLSSLYIKKGNDFVLRAKEINKVIMTLGLGLFVFVNLFSEELVRIIYTDKYLAALIITVPLSFVLLFRVWASIYAVILTISEHQNVRVIIVFVSLVVNLILNLTFIPTYGFEGAAYVSLATHFVLIALYVLFTKKFINSILIDSRVVLYAVGTIFLIVLLSYFNLDLGFIESLAAILIWVASLFLIYSKKQLYDLKLLFLARL